MKEELVHSLRVVAQSGPTFEMLGSCTLRLKLLSESLNRNRADFDMNAAILRAVTDRLDGIIAMLAERKMIGKETAAMAGDWGLFRPQLNVLADVVEQLMV